MFLKFDYLVMRVRKKWWCINSLSGKGNMDTVSPKNSIDPWTRSDLQLEELAKISM